MNELKHMAEFRSVLKDYKPSSKAQEILKSVKMVLLTAPTAGGRNTIIDKLVGTGHYHFFLSDTTRKPRVNNGVPEKNGREYWFRTEEELLEDLKRGEFLEAQIIHNQQVSGISIRELERTEAMHKIAINEVDTKGISNVLPVKPDTIGILIIPPHFDEWQRRVNKRGEMTPAERRNRFETAAEVYKMAAEGRYPVIINDDLADAVRKVDHLARLGELLEDQKHAHKVASQLYQDTQQYLQKV